MNFYNKIFSVFTLYLIAILPGNAQEISSNTLYMQNLYGINPAFVGSTDGIFGAIQSKSQFSGLADAPRTYMFNVHAPLPGNLGLGARVISDARGAFDHTSGELSASYRVGITSKDFIQFGLSGGYIKNAIRTSRISVNQYVNTADPTLTSDLFNQTSFRFRTGIWYQHENLDISVSFPQLMVDGQKFHEHIISMASYRFALSNDWMLMPSALYQVLPFSPDQVEVNLMGQWRNMIWAQTGYRSNNSAVFSAGINISNIRIGYAYETANQYLSNISRGSHEVLLAINVPVKIKKRVVEVETPTEQESTIVYVEKEDTVKVKELEREIALLREQLGHDVAALEIKDIDTVSKESDYYTITVDQDGNEQKEAITPGNYIVVNTCTDNKFAHHLVDLYQRKGIEASVVFDSKKKYYYIHTDKIDDFDEAVSEMKNKRENGFKNAWVLVYK